MKNKLFLKAGLRAISESIARIIFATTLITTALDGAVFTNQANAQDINTNLLANKVAGKLMLKADIGYVYSFGGDWNKSNAKSPSIGGNTSVATGGVGYGVSLGYTHKSGLGLSADYLGFNHKWTGAGTDVNSKTEFNYDASYHVVTLVPNYRIKLDSANHWGLRLGFGVGFSISDVSWAQKISASNGAQSGGTKVAGGAVYSMNSDATSIAPADFGTPAPTLTGNCAAASGQLSKGLAFSDSQGSTDSVNSFLAAGSLNKCNIIGGDLGDAVAGFTDAQILAGLNSGKALVFDSNAAHPIAYNVWSQVFGAGGNATSLSALSNNNIVNFQSGTAVTIADATWSNLSDRTQAGLRTAGVTNTTRAAAASAAATSACASKGAGYTYANGVCNPPAPAASGGSAKDDAGVVIAPQAALEYDNGMLHADVNVKYIHELFNVRYFGSEGSVSGTATSGAITYMSKAGPLALFIGAGLGINF